MGNLDADTHLKPPANPGAAATAILLDTTAVAVGGVLTTMTQRAKRPADRRAICCAIMDQAATFFIDVMLPGSTTWRTVNGNGSGEPIAANTFFERDVLLISDDTRIRIVTVNAPTVWEVSVRLCGDRGLGQ